MKLIISRSQAEVKGMFGGHKGMSFTLKMRLDLTREEAALIERYSLGYYGLWERGPVAVTVQDLVKGDVQNVSNVELLLRSESIAKTALDKLPQLFDVLRSFGGDEVVEYPRTHVDGT